MRKKKETIEETEQVKVEEPVVNDDKEVVVTITTENNAETFSDFVKTMANKKSTINCSPGLFTLLTVAFVVLKLCGVINWSWIWVFSLVWIPACLALLFIGFIVGIWFYYKDSDDELDNRE